MTRAGGGIISREAEVSGQILTEHRGYADIQLRSTYVGDAPLCTGTCIR